MQIERAHVRALSRAILRLRDAAAIPAFHTRVLRAVAEIAPSDIISFNEMDPRAGTLLYYDEPLGACLFSPDAQEIFLSCAHEHPLVKRLDAAEGPTVSKISDYLGQRAFRRLRLYGEFYRPLRVEHQIALSIPVGTGRFVAVALNRSSPDFSEIDRFLLEELTSHVIAARAEDQAREAIRPATGEEIEETWARSGLTKREIAVTRWLTQGKSNADIAAILGISPRTVQKHLEHVFSKLGVESRTAAVRAAAEVARRRRR